MRRFLQLTGYRILRKNAGMNIAKQIIIKFGGPRKLAALLNSPPTTIYSWADRGFVPARRQLEVLRAAARAGVDLTPADFFREVE